MDLAALVQECTPPHVAHQTMQAVMRVESGGKPYAIGYKIVRMSDKQEFVLNIQPKTREQAIAWAKWLTENDYAFDAGRVQVNSRNFKKYGLTYETAFDDCNNIRVGALILHECWSRAKPKYREPQVALRASLSCYQSGNFSTGFRTGYVQKVEAAALK